MPEQSAQEQQLRNRYKIRQVTNIQASWVEQERGEEGKFTLQLILDSGVDEYVLDVDADDLEVMLKLFKTSEHTTFDLERKGADVQQSLDEVARSKLPPGVRRK